MTGLIIFALVVALAGSLAAVVTFPRWCLRTIQRYRLRKFRNSYVDALLERRLPSDNPAVVELLTLAQRSLRRPPFTFVGMTAFRWAKRAFTDAELARFTKHAELLPLGQLSPAEAAMLTEFRSQFETLVVGEILLSTWIGVPNVLLAAPKTIGAVWKYAHGGADSLDPKLRTHLDAMMVARTAAREATDRATASTKLGRAIREELERNPCRMLPPD